MASSHSTVATTVTMVTQAWDEQLCLGMVHERAEVHQAVGGSANDGPHVASKTTATPIFSHIDGALMGGAAATVMLQHATTCSVPTGSRQHFTFCAVCADERFDLMTSSRSFANRPRQANITLDEGNVQVTNPLTGTSRICHKYCAPPTAIGSPCYCEGRNAAGQPIPVEHIHSSHNDTPPNGVSHYEDVVVDGDGRFVDRGGASRAGAGDGTSPVSAASSPGRPVHHANAKALIAKPPYCPPDSTAPILTPTFENLDKVCLKAWLLL